jgi:hypothetical protein
MVVTLVRDPLFDRVVQCWPWRDDVGVAGLCAGLCHTMVDMSTHPVAIRFDEALLEQVRQWAQGHAMTVSALVQSMTEEGLRLRAHPGIVFRDGPAGRRAGLARGMDVWEVIGAVRQVDGRSQMPPAELADQIGLGERDLGVALEYYAHYPEEIDRWIDDNQRYADEAERRWQAKRALLA